ncbi:phage head closure protein [Xanthovirga aplysinae]|uniref:phage head closure protein n=1 Tax=Xanthovirga aplysinae TaxID=2529853 RepID=UPI0012BCDD9F|nr:phage head closure protein [Xanthovirga aplysinae]MTI32813.1 head-tail adaptor protein [Xanthovirga aplysinae]
MIGLLDRKIIIQERFLTKDNFGEAIESWEDKATVWAEKEYINGNEKAGEHQTVYHEQVQFKIRYYSGLTTKHRLKEGEQLLDILNIKEEGRKKYLLIKAQARDNE